MYDALILSSGGAKGILFGGVMRGLYEKKILQKIKTFIGSSVGAWLALALALGYTLHEIMHLCMIMDLAMFFDRDVDGDVIAKVSNLVMSKGVHSPDRMYEFICGIVQKKTELAALTFQQLYRFFGRELIVTACCVNTLTTRYLSRQTCPDMPIAKAVAISSCIPFVFMPTEYDGKLYVDGATFGHGMPHDFEQMPCDIAHTIGVRLLDSPSQTTREITNVYEYTRLLAVGVSMSRKQWRIPIVCLDIFSPDDIWATSRDIPDLKRRSLINHAYTQTMEFLINLK